MYTDNDLAKMKSKGLLDSDDENQEKSLRWLLEMDLSEPEERLFTVAGNEYSDAGLSALEAEVAGRPMIRGNADSDDLASYVDEEIVITSAGEANDIYARSDTADVDERARTSREEVMSIEFSREWEDRDTGAPSSVEEGADILGLAGDDDIGEKFLSITRVKSTVVSNEKDERAATTEAISDQTTDTTEDLAETTLEAEGDEGLEVGDFESIDVENTNDEAIAITLTGAPVTTLVADPGVDIVANDSESEDGLEHISVLDYVANMPQPEDDDEFDSYLLGGEHLVDDGTDPDELVIQRTEGIVAVDPSTEVSIDYHEDFSSMEGFERDDVAEIAAVIAPVMDEISRDVRARLESLGLAADAIVVDVKLGSDEESIKQCYAQGYEPAYAICSEMPQPMRALDQSAREAIYVRLMHAESGKTWNDLFGEDFVALIDTDTAHEDHTDALTDIDVQSAESIEAEAVLTVDDALGDGFGEDIFGDDFTDDFADDFAADLMGDDHLAAADIEAAFSSLSQGEDVDDDIDGVSFEDVQENVDDSEVVTTELEEDLTVEAAIPVELEAHEQEEGEEEGEIFATRYEFEDEVQEAAPFDGTRLGGFIPDYIDFSYTSQSNTEIFADFLDAFIEEGSVEVEKLENEVGEWEKNVESEPLFANVSRTLHTIKGIAKGVGLQRLGTLVHNFETLLDKMPRPNEDEEQAYFRIVNVWLDAVVRGVEFVAENRADIATEFPVQGTDSQSGQAPEVEASEATDSVGAEVAATEVVPAEIKVSTTSALEKKRDQQLADEGAKVLAAQQSVRITSEKLDHLLNLTSQAQQLGVRASQNTTRSKRSSAELQARLSSVRTHIRKIADRALLNVNARPGSTTPDLDALEMDQYSELQEAASILREGVEDLTDLVEVVSRQNILIEALLKQQSSVISGISSSIQGARVVPVSRLMPGLRRIVRTVSTDLGKVVSFNVLNETGALDRDHYARLQVILEHMVRNALDHGIESPDERVAMGKPTGGRVTIDVRKSGGDYLIRLSDDGKGIDPDAIRESAYEKGLDIDVEALSDDEAIRLIFHKGFTTASTLSEISGRGVGMDIVLTELQQIGGDIQIQSAVGLGTAFEVRIPSNVSVNGALLVAAANESYAIPLNGLISVEQVPVDEFFAAVEAGGTLPISDMECEPAYLGTLCQGVGLPDRSVWDTFVPVIIAGSADRYMAIAIDNLEEALELVVRSLGSQFSTVPGVAGAATTAEGEAIVALDLNLLVSSAGADGVAPSAESRAESTTLLALVVDDSRTQRMVATSQLDTVGVETVTAENGLVAIDLLNASHRLPDVILLDVEMPVKDGIQTLREIRKSRRYGHLPVIMVTSRTGTKHRALAHDAGCSAYMGKPFNFPALIKQINELTGHDLQLS